MAKEESKTTGHQFKSDTLDATPTARMSGEAHLSLCKGGQIPHSTRKRGVLKHHHFSTSVPQILQKNSSCTTRSLFFSQHIRLFSVAVLPGWENYFEYTATLDELTKDTETQRTNFRSVLTEVQHVQRKNTLHNLSSCRRACRSRLYARCAKEHNMKFSTLCSPPPHRYRKGQIPSQQRSFPNLSQISRDVFAEFLALGPNVDVTTPIRTFRAAILRHVSQIRRHASACHRNTFVNITLKVHPTEGKGKDV